MTLTLEIKRLKNKRSYIKGRLTKFKNHLDQTSSLENVSPIDISQLSLKLSRLQALYHEFDEVQSQIESFPESNQAEELNTRDTIEQDFDNYISITQTFIETHSTPKDDPDPMSTSSSPTHCHHDNCKGLGFKLPVIRIPNFDGTYFKWLEFKETYISLVHDNSNIKNIHKFHYLQSYLEGEAARVLSNLEITDANYSEAWSLLCKRYDNKRQLINNHLKALFSIDTVRETDKSLRFIVDHVNKNLRALRTLGLPTEKWDVLIIYMVTAKLDSSTCYKWEEHRSSLPEIPMLSQFFDFLKNRADVLETVNRQKYDRTKHPPPQIKLQSKSFALTTKYTPSTPTSTIECSLCQGSHRLYECTTFKTKSPEDRVSIVSKLNLCTNCLRAGHKIQNCRLPGSCRSCKQKHNTLLHVSSDHSAMPNTSSTQTHNLAAMTTSDVLLCTAQVQLKNPDSNKVMMVRALLDSGSQSTFITEDVRRILNLPTQPSNVSIVGLADTPLPIDTRRCILQLQSLTEPFNVNMACLVIPKIADKLPKSTLDISQYDISQFQLADPTFFEVSSISMIIGSDLFWDLIGSSQHSLGTNNPILRSSKLGWLIAGPLPTLPISKPKNKSLHCNFLYKEPNLPTINDELQRFWELENIPQSHPYSLEEKLCEQHYTSNTYRLESGRFCVGLPLRDQKDCLGDSYSSAKKRFLSLEARFKKQPELKVLYCDFIKEYAELNHLSVSATHKPSNAFFLPHHPVIRAKSESTKLRVVFDASARSTSGFSINDLQMVGPVIQDSLFNILLRFRQYKYIISGDIEKMFRQVLVRESDRDMQLILWRENETDPLCTLRLNTVTYGFSSASYLTTRCIRQLGDECTDPTIKTILQNDFYCDDLLTGGDSIEDVKYIQRQVASELSKGCFHLRNYRSNLADLLDTSFLPEEGSLIISNATSTLGIGWCPNSDNLQFQIEHSPTANLTKRSILSSTFKIFDPLGLLSLCTIKPKILLQTLWALKLDWDEEVPQNIKKSWSNFTQSLDLLSSLNISRRVLIDDAIYVEMHCFSDASQQAYGACIYLRSRDATGNVQTSLLCAKARVAPLKPTTIPRLELCGAHLGAQLSSAVTQALRCEIHRHVYWTDSKVVLAWLKSPNKTKTFVANRVVAISDLSGPNDWRYVPTAENPADLCSRGVDPQRVIDADLWWHGPTYLMQPESKWPRSDNESTTIELPELKALPTLVAESAPAVPLIKINKFSKFTRLQRVLARVFRFIHNVRHDDKLTGILSVHELKQSLNFLIKISQIESFPKELACLQSNKPLPSKSKLISLNVFIDSENLIRVGGRIGNSNYPYDKQHPILLSAKHHLTKLIFQYEHDRLLHAPPQLLLASVRDQYWPISGRKLARDIYQKCVKCRRFKGSGMTNIMSDLPPERVEPDFPFSTVAIDCAHFNGLAEAGVKSAKFHIRRILGQTHLTYEELSSLFAQVECILNSRPLCPLSPSPNDFQTLTPAHFLIGRPLTSLPSASYGDTETPLRDRFQRLEQIRYHFWKRWSREYIAELQQRTKWRLKCKDLRLDDLVLIKEETPPLYWHLGRVSKLSPGPDGVPRVADVTTANGTLRRALNRLCLLPATGST